MRAAVSVLGALAFAVAPAGAQAADPVHEVVTVPGKYGRTWVEVTRPAGGAKVPIILTLSPYNTLGEQPGGWVSDDALAATYVPKGYARAVADVLGTRNSTGCWDYGGPREQQAGVDTVNALAREPWSNGKVAMIGGSYDGTTANMVAVRGDDVPGLAAIVPQSAINHWYGYAYQDGVRYFANTDVPTDEGVDTPLGFDFGLARTPPTKPDADSVADLPAGRYNPCDSADHTAHGYDTTPDYDAFWQARDYLKDAANVRVPVLVTHGWQDYNVKQSEGVDFYEALGPRVPFKQLFMFQGTHEGAPSDPYDKVLERFFDHTLKGVDNGVERDPAVLTQGRAGLAPDPHFRAESAWPPPGTRGVAFALGRGADGHGVLATSAGAAQASFTDTGTTTEEGAMRDPASERSWLYYATAPLDAPVRLAGSAVLEARVVDSADHGQLDPTLVDVAPDGSVTPIARGFANLQYRAGLARAVPVPAGAPVDVNARLAPQDQTVAAGHRIGLIVASSNTAWAIPSPPSYTVGVVHGGASRLVLPVVGPPDATTPAMLPGAGGRPAPLPASVGLLTLSAHRHGRVLVVSGRTSAARVSIRATQRGARATVRRVRAAHGRYRARVRLRGRGTVRVRVTTRTGGRVYSAARVLR
jgi:X-Pro dipeptidyl-peptidase